ncbi:MAG: ATP-binding protein [Actinobacteria bacterium]|nr:ATP-binding protein [Actinomycetota bacterium]
MAGEQDKIVEEQIIKKYEDLLRRYNILNRISRIVASTTELDKILSITLKGVTFGDGFGFNRAFLFLLNQKMDRLTGRLAIGTETAEEAWKIWGEIQKENYSLEEFISQEKLNDQGNLSLNDRLKKITIQITPGKIIDQCLTGGEPVNVDLTKNSLDENSDYFIDASKIENEILELIQYPKFCLIPLISRTRKVGLLVVDNKYNNREITQDDMTFLMMLGSFAASSIRNTIIYNELKESLNNLAKVNYQIKILKEYNENIIESIPLSMFVVDNNFILTACNKNFSDIMHTSKENLIGKNIRNFKIFVNDFNLIDEIANVMSEKKIEGFYKVKIVMNDVTSDSIFNLMLVLLKDSKDSIDGVIGILEDVTDLVKLEKSLQEAKRFSELGKFSATIAHEIRNPLVSIGGYANRIKRRYIEKKEFDINDINIITDEIKRLEEILKDILDYSSDKKADFKTINLCEVLRYCIDLVKISAEQNNINITLLSGENFLDKYNLIINGSYDNLKQAFINLLNNAIEASTSKQTVYMDTEIIEDSGQKWIKIKINNKAFIQNEKDLYKIFLPFYTTKIHGTGLGLTLTKKIIEEHSGNIDVESNRENGTTFTIKLPLLRIDENV